MAEENNKHSLISFLEKKFSPFLGIHQEQIQRESFSNKWNHAHAIISGELESGTKEQPVSSTYGILDFPFLFIPRILSYAADSLQEEPWVNYTWKEGVDVEVEKLLWAKALQQQEIPAQYNERVAALEIPPAWFLRNALHCLLNLPFFIQKCVGYFLTTVFTIIPIIPLMDWFYPDENEDVPTGASENQKKQIRSANHLKGQDRRRLFFNPSTAMFFFILSAGISFLIQAVNPAIFAEAVLPLFIMQTIFVGIAGLMLVGAVLSLLYYGIERLVHNPLDEHATMVDGKEIPGKPRPQSGVINYLSEFKNWRAQHPTMAKLVIALGVVSVLTVLALTIGFFTGGFGLFPEAFTFMGPVFNFIASGFASGIHAASALPGLEFLGSMSGATMHLIGQVLSVFTLFAAAIFVPDTLRRVLQTGWPPVVVPSEGALQAAHDGVPFPGVHPQGQPNQANAVPYNKTFSPPDETRAQKDSVGDILTITPIVV